jgi:hypothetical protein
VAGPHTLRVTRFGAETCVGEGSRRLLAHRNLLFQFFDELFQPVEDSGLDLVGISFLRQVLILDSEQ